jgi:hypothetical protein
MDFNFKKNNYLLPYWVFKFIDTKYQNPTFLNDISTNNLTPLTTNTQDWPLFLKKSLSNKPNNLKNSLVFLENLDQSTNTHTGTNQNSYATENLVNINFLRYERLYTKLKYSRSPAYDIVSGGAAALLAGFLGFLISEKFGFELVDSGDFYYLFMYIVFGVFLLKPLLYIANVNTTILSTLSYRNILNFIIKIILLVTHTIKNKLL